ncbi:MAG: hypothetical protein NTW96_14995 [Planctomycetia bacterium]|nr:hypothetical protein [Planctomycetia bacterium]
MKSLLSVATAGAILYGLIAPATAAIVVQRLGEDQSATEGQLPGLPGLVIPLPETDEAAAQPTASGQRRASTAPPSQAAPAATPQQMMPLPPTVAPGSPASTGAGQAGQTYPGLPASPTGPYDPNSQSAGPGMGFPTSPGATGSGASPGGLAAVPQPTPVSPLGMVPSDPSTGRYQMNTIPEATAPRPPAQVPQARQDIKRGNKPFAGYSAPSAYSPYMNLFRGENSARGLNNYYSYVKPALDQQRQDMTSNREIQGLQDTARYGAQSAEQMGQRPGSVIPGNSPKIPATFMNYQQFFPQYKK